VRVVQVRVVQVRVVQVRCYVSYYEVLCEVLGGCYVRC
jgi:hypothetical protein